MLKSVQFPVAILIAFLSAQSVSMADDRPTAEEMLAKLSALESKAAQDGLSGSPVELTDLVRGLNEVAEYGAATRACDLLKRMAGLRADDLMSCAEPLLARGRIEKATELLDLYVEDAKDDGRGIEPYAEAAGALERWAWFDRAASFLARGVESFPDDHESCLRMVGDLLRAGKPGEAAVAAQGAVGGLDEGGRDFLRRVSLLFVGFGEAERAVPLAAALVALEGLDDADLDAALTVAAETGDESLARDAVDSFTGSSDDPGQATATAAGMLEKHGMLERAVTLYRESIRSGTLDGPEYLFGLGRLQVKSGKFGNAAKTFGRYLSRAGDDATSGAVRVAAVWTEAGKPVRAIGVLSRHESLANRDWVFAMGRARHESGDDPGEWETYERAGSHMPDPATFWLLVGDTLSTRDNPDYSAEAFRHAINTASGDPKVLGPAHAGLAESLVRMDSVTDGDVEIELRLALKNSGGDVLLLNRIEKTAKRIKPSGGLNVALLEAAVQNAPKDSGLWRRLGEACVKAGLGGRAVDAFSKSIGTSEDMSGALELSIVTLLDSGMRTEALGLASRFADSSIRISAELSETLGRNCLAAMDRTCASLYVSRFLQAPVDMNYDYGALGSALTRAGLWRLAANAFEYATRATPIDNQWQIHLLRGVLELERDKVAEADVLFEMALQESPQKRKTLLRIAREYESRSMVLRSAQWYSKALGDRDENFKARVLPVLGNLFFRLGTPGRLIEEAKKIDLSNFGTLRQVAVRLAASGLFAEALNLVERWGKQLAKAGEAAYESLLEALMFKAGRIDTAFELARGHCGTDPDKLNEAACVLSAHRFAGILRTDRAARLLRSLCATGKASAATLLDWAVLQYRLGHGGEAIETVKAAAGLVQSPSDLIHRVGPFLFNESGAKSYLAVLERMESRKDLSEDPELRFEIGRVRIATGERKRGLADLRAYAGLPAGNLARVYRELAVRQERQAALDALESATDDSISMMQPGDLRDICLDLARTGYPQASVRLLARFRKANKGIEAARETLGRVYREMGLNQASVDALNEVRDPNLTPQGLSALLRALSSLDRLDDVEKRAASYFDTLPTKDLAEADARSLVSILDLLESEGLTPRFVRYFDAHPGVLPASRLPRMAIETARSGIQGAIEKGRALFLDGLSTATTLSDDAVEYIRLEVVRKSGPDLLAAIRERPSGPATREAAWTTSCLLGLPVDALPEDLDGTVAAARALFRCGRWKPAYEAALASLGFRRPGAPLDSLVEMATVSGRMAGVDGLMDTLRERIERLTDDEVARRHLTGISALVNGSHGELFTLFSELAKMSPMDGRQQLAAIEGALWEGDVRHIGEANVAALNRSEDVSEATTNIAGLFNRSLRPDLARSVLEPLAKVFPGDRALARALVGAALFEADPEARLRHAASYLSRFGGGDDVAWLVGTAADSLSVGVVDRYIDELDGSDPSSGIGLMKAGTMYLRIGREKSAYAAVQQAFERTRDGRELASALAWSVIIDPDVPASLLRSVIARRPDLLKVSEDLPLVSAARCLDTASGYGDAELCAHGILAKRYLGVSILLQAARKALLGSRPEIGLALLEKAMEADRSRAVGMNVLGVIVSVVWPAEDMAPDLRRRFGNLAIAAAGKDSISRMDPSVTPYAAHIHDMMGDLDGGIGVYERLIELAPSNAGLRNNLAYMLSVRKVDYERAVREARIASILFARNASFYMETEAWAEFLRGRTKVALRLQEDARRLWSTDQGGGLSESFDHLGRILEAAGRPDDARRAYRRAFLSGPLDRNGRDALMRWRILEGNSSPH